MTNSAEDAISSGGSAGNCAKVCYYCVDVSELCYIVGWC